uniref:Uncharacterized protein n=1 Tax=Solanum lycopersicum TaxID=4081 RepID=A0A3Q7HGF7_SOLLC
MPTVVSWLKLLLFIIAVHLCGSSKEWRLSVV